MSGVSVVKCDGCGADMVYSPERAALYCPYCESVKRINKLSVGKRNYYKEKNLCDVVDVRDVYKCPNCGGEVVVENFATTTKCPFCNATNIVKRENIHGLRPDAILPVAYSKKEAFEAGKHWIKKKLFAPSKIKKDFKADNFSGTYFPSFSFSSDTISHYHGRLGEYYYVTVKVGKETRRERRIRWFSISGTHTRFFSDVLVEASKLLEQKELNAILPYDTENSEGYQAEYLAGFYAERYDTDIEDCFGVAKSQMDKKIRSEILAKYTYDVVGELHVDTEYPTVAFNHTLLPLWVCGYKYKDKNYRFIVNGRTGKSTGKYPKSAPRVCSAVLLGLCALAGIITAILFYLGYIG